MGIEEVIGGGKKVLNVLFPSVKDVIAKAIELVTFLFAAFSGYLRGIAPPEEADSRFAVGLASFLCLCVLLLLSTLLRLNQDCSRYRVVALATAAALFVTAAVSGLVYKYNLDRLLFAYPPESSEAMFVGGTQFTPQAEADLKEQPRSTSQLVADYGGLPARELVWTKASMERARTILIVNYVLFVLSVAGVIFGLAEGFLVAQTPAAPGDEDSQQGSADPH